MEGKDCLCYSTKVVEYSHNVCLIEGCLDYLFTILYARIQCGTHRVSAVVVVAVVVVVLVVVIVVVEVLVTVVVPAM